MLALDFINIGNGDCILIREMEGTQQKFALMVDFGHDCLVRDDHPGELDPRSQRIYAGDFLRELGVTHLDVVLATYFHRDHIGGLGRVLDAVTIDRFTPPICLRKMPRSWTPSIRITTCPRLRETPFSASRSIPRRCKVTPTVSSSLNWCRGRKRFPSS